MVIEKVYEDHHVYNVLRVEFQYTEEYANKIIKQLPDKLKAMLSHYNFVFWWGMVIGYFAAADISWGGGELYNFVCTCERKHDKYLGI